MDLIIQPEEVGLLSRPLSQHISHAELTSYITEAEQMIIRPALGDDLFSAIKSEPNKYEVLLNGGDGICGGVRKALAYYVYARYVKDGSIRTTSSGVVMKTDEYATNIEQERKNSIYRDCMSIADTYLQEVVNYANAHGMMAQGEVGATRRTAYVIGDEGLQESQQKVTPKHSSVSGDVVAGIGINISNGEISVNMGEVRKGVGVEALVQSVANISKEVGDIHQELPDAYAEAVKAQTSATNAALSAEESLAYSKRAEQGYIEVESKINEFDSEIGNLNAISRSFIDLGVVSTSSEAEQQAVDLAGLPEVNFIKYMTSNGQTGLIRQMYSSTGQTLQFLWLNGVEFVRTVAYDAGIKSAWRNINKASLVYKLMYNNANKKLEFHDPIQDEGFGGVTLPDASTSNAGLMTTTQVTELNNAVKTTGAQSISGEKTFNDSVKIAGKSVIAKNIDPGEFKLLHNNSNKGFIIRTRNTSDNILPVEILSTNGYDSFKYEFPQKSGTVAMLDDINGGSAIPENLTTQYDYPLSFFGLKKTGAFYMTLRNLDTRTDFPSSDENRYSLKQAYDGNITLKEGMYEYLKGKNLTGYNLRAYIRCDALNIDLGGPIDCCLFAEIYVKEQFDFLLYAKLFCSLGSSGEYKVIQEVDFRNS